MRIRIFPGMAVVSLSFADRFRFGRLGTLGFMVLLVAFYSPVSLRASSVDTVYLEIAVEGVRTVPVGVIPFGHDSSDWSLLDEHPEEILARDFFLSGRLEPVPQPSFSRLAFFKARAAYYVTGQLSHRDDGTIQVDCRLKATQSQQQIIGQSYPISPNQYREAIHDFADQVLFQITGASGVASTRLAYVAKYKSDKQIIVSDYDGHNAAQITHGDGLHFMPSWNQDGSKLYYTRFQNSSSHLVERTVATGAERSLFSKLGQCFSPVANPTGADILFTVASAGASDIWRGVPATGKTERLTYQKTSETSPSYSPNGQEILYSADRGGAPQIYIMDKDGADARRVTFLGRYNESAAWSPAGDRIVYTSMEGGQFNIYTCNLDGEDVVQLTSNAGNNEHPVWSPDGMLIAFSSTRSGTSQIYLMRKDGSGVTRITSGVEHTWPTWAPFTPKGENP
ncbi:MAG TPA: translocation protein TolB [Fibrobacteraceae bacterium]|nr:translocation protein TolB [Fibrobacteraceae bacterium]